MIEETASSLSSGSSETTLHSMKSKPAAWAMGASLMSQQHPIRKMAISFRLVLWVQADYSTKRIEQQSL
jgi:hypothetical protein